MSNLQVSFIEQNSQNICTTDKVEELVFWRN